MGGLRLFGFTIGGDFPWSTPLTAGEEGPADLILSLSENPVFSAVQTSQQPIYTSLLHASDGESLCLLYRQLRSEVLRFARVGDFRIKRSLIDSYIPSARLDLAELRLLGPVMSYWLELRGFPTLHASAVAVNGHAVAFVSRHGGGKSGLAAAMVQAGFPLLTDDIVALEEGKDGWEVRPAYPEMRMWPDEAAHFVGSPEALPLVQAGAEKRRVAIGGGGFGSFLDATTPLDCIYLASRRPEEDGGIEIQPISRSEALIELVRYSFSARLVEAAGLQPARLDRLARLVRSVPVRRLVYPSGFDRLPEVVTLMEQ
jgi:hypothetical protein